MPDIVDAASMFPDLGVDTAQAERMAAWRMLNRYEAKYGKRVPVNLLEAWVTACRLRGRHVMRVIFERHLVMHRAMDELEATT